MYIRLKLLREKYNFSLEEISNYLGISLKLYIDFESGIKTIPINYLSKLARKYNTSIDYIIEDTDEITPHKKNNSTK